MVLWEITVATAYFLGLKRTYRLALKLQRRIVSPRHPKIRQFLHRRTRNVFDMAFKVHLKIQERDIEYGRSVGNWILRWLDKMKPQAQIRVKHNDSNHTTTMTKHSSNNSRNTYNQASVPKHSARTKDKESSMGRHFFTATTHDNVWPKSFPTVAMLMRPIRPVGHNIKYRHFSVGNDSGFLGVNYGRFGSGNVVRNDIRLWLRAN